MVRDTVSALVRDVELVNKKGLRSQAVWRKMQEHALHKTCVKDHSCTERLLELPQRYTSIHVMAVFSRLECTQVSSSYTPNSPILSYRRSLDQRLLVSLPKDTGKVG